MKYWGAYIAKLLFVQLIIERIAFIIHLKISSKYKCREWIDTFSIWLHACKEILLSISFPKKYSNDPWKGCKKVYNSIILETMYYDRKNVVSEYQILQ